MRKGTVMSRIEKKPGIIIEVNRQCNLRCNFCPVPLSSKKMERSYAEIKKLLRDPLIEKIVEKKDGRIRHLSISGGEPFLHSEINKIIELFSDLAVEVLVVSNLTKVSKEQLELIKSRDNVFLQISFVSFESSLYKKITGKNLFKQFLKNTIMAMNILGKERIFANVVVGKENEGQLEWTMKGITSMGIKNIRIHPIVAVNEKMKKLLPENYYIQVNKMAEKYKKSNINLKIVYPINYRDSYYWYLSMDNNITNNLFIAYVG